MYFECYLIHNLHLIDTDVKESADLWLLNSCTVKNPAEDHFRNEVTAGRKAGKHVVVAGCVPQGTPKADYIQVRTTSKTVPIICKTGKHMVVAGCIEGTPKADYIQVRTTSKTIPIICKTGKYMVVAGCIGNTQS